jgi:hypothetical protein
MLRKDGVALPTLAKNKHPKISNGSVLIELSCSKTQGRYLEVNNCQFSLDYSEINDSK